VAEKRQQLTFRGMQRRMERSERRHQRLTLGRWEGVYSVVRTTLGTSTRGNAILNLGSPASKTEYYGWDGMVTITIVATPAAPDIEIGAVMGYHIRVGQTAGDYWATNNYRPNQSSPDWQQHGRAARYLPIALIGDVSATRGSVSIPFAALFPKTLMLKQHETYEVGYGMTGLGTFSVTTQAYGRYRTVQAP